MRNYAQIHIRITATNPSAIHHSVLTSAEFEHIVDMSDDQDESPFLLWVHLQRVALSDKPDENRRHSLNTLEYPLDQSWEREHDPSDRLHTSGHELDNEHTGRCVLHRSPSQHGVGL